VVGMPTAKDALAHVQDHYHSAQKGVPQGMGQGMGQPIPQGMPQQGMY
jgi:hypothetical protein